MEECRFHIGDVVQHFKRENINPETADTCIGFWLLRSIQKMVRSW